MSEIIDLIVMSIYLGYIFSGILPRHRENYDPLKHHFRKYDWSGFRFVILATAPAVILHELSHKFVAMGFGFDAIFMAFYRDIFTLTLAVFSVIAKAAGLGFVFIVPGFVSIIGSGTPLQYALTSLAGPLANLAFWLTSLLILKHKKYSRKSCLFWALTKRINGFLFVFNMLPIPGFDGYKFFGELFRALF